MAFRSITQLADADFPTRWGHFRILGFEGVVDHPLPCNPAQPAPEVRTETAVALVMGDIHLRRPPSSASTPSASPATSSTRSAATAASSSSSPSPPSPKPRPASSSTSTRKAAASALWPSSRPYELQDQGLNTIEANHRLGFKSDCRNYELPAEILKHLGVPAVRLITNNPEKVAALEEHGIQVIERLQADVEADPNHAFYLQTKREKMGHLVG